ncbi:MAG: hypothetical protein VKJ05_03490 [Synechococcaceae cyanobacterium]|nr:hypothetical protein [Synechococcaceae cyanobacterium]
MAESADRGDPTQLYTAIEKAYCEDRWSEVIERGGRLLDELKEQDRALGQRLQLLMAHAYLYGHGDRDSAEDLYRAVHESQAEVELRKIAAHGLEQCDLPPQRLPTAGDSRWSAPRAPEASPSAGVGATEPDDQPPPRIHPNPAELPQPAAAPSLDDNSGASLHESLQALIPDLPAEEAPALESAPAMPWLESLGGVPSVGEAGPQPGVTLGSSAAPVDLPWTQPAAPAAVPGPERAPEPERKPEPPASRESLIPEVVEEPELIEVHQADPALAEEVELQESQRQQAFREEAPIALAEPTPPPPVRGLPRPARAETAPPIEEDPDLLRGLLRVELF